MNIDVKLRACMSWVPLVSVFVMTGTVKLGLYMETVTCDVNVNLHVGLRGSGYILVIPCLSFIETCSDFVYRGT